MDTKTLNATINAVCVHLRNFFVIPNQRIAGSFVLNNGKINLSKDMKVGQWIYIEPTGEHTEAVGSYRIIAKTGRKGYTYTLDGLEGVSDTWRGIIYGQRIPHEFILLCERIAAWEAENAPSNLLSENVANFYSMTFATGEDGLPNRAMVVFKKDLARFNRQMATGVKY